MEELGRTMEELGRTEVILDGVGRLEEAQELVDVRLEVVDLVWNWESQGLVAEGAVRTYIYYQKEDGTIEGEGVEIPFHGVVLPPGNPVPDVRVRLEDVREEHQFEPKDRSFTQSIHLRLVAEQPARARALEEAAPLAPENPAPGEAAPEPAAEGAPASVPAYQGAAVSDDPGDRPEPDESAPESPEREGWPVLEPEEAPLVAAHVAQGPNGTGPGLQGAEPRPEPPTADDTVIVWKPFPDE
ncbi:MAG TPA: hypothetical protein VIL08_03840 [Limnochorda sp.]